MARILIVEDNWANTRLTQLLLEMAGHTSITAADAETGVSLAEDAPPDLILLDIQTPELDGIGAVRLFRKNPATAAIPIVAMTFMCGAKTHKIIQEAGCDGWIAKPVRYQELNRAVDMALAKSDSLKAENLEPTLATIVVAEGVPADREALIEMLAGEGYKTAGVSTAEAVLEEIHDTRPDLILLGSAIAEHSGQHIIASLKSDPANAGIPIIMLTAREEVAARIKGLHAGAEDFLIKPVDRAELWLRVRNLLRLKEYTDFLQTQGDILKAQVLKRTAQLRRFRSAMDVAPVAILLIDPDTGHFVEVNTTACDMLGYSREELFGLGPAHFGGAVLEELSRTPRPPGTESEHIMEDTLQRHDGTTLHVEVHQHIQESEDGQVSVVVLRDITDRKESEKRLQHMAHHDALTGLANRGFFLTNLEKTLSMANSIQEQVAVMFVDFDGFKDINDKLGHSMGDELLVQVGDRLVECLRSRDIVGRLGGDEFAIALVTKDGQHDASTTAAKIQKELRSPFHLNGHEVLVTASIGIAIYPQDATSPEDLLNYADTAMYRAKLAGRDTFRFFTAQMNEELKARLELEAALRKAIDDQEFVIHYQPKGRVVDRKIAGLEALLRWERPGHGVVYPSGFIQALEDTGLIRRVGGWVIDEVCTQIERWQRLGIGPVAIAVNVTSRQFAEDDLEDVITKSLSAHGIPGEFLELEITETTMMANSERTINTLRRLKALGLKVSIDDFGTGYSSLSYLQRLPVDKLKIDGSFVREIGGAKDGTITSAIIQLAKSLGLEVIAEGVETPEQFSYLRQHLCDQIQGYYLSEARPPGAIESMLLAPAWSPRDESIRVEQLHQLESIQGSEQPEPRGHAAQRREGH